jgi:hypothetical protein
MRGNFQYVQQDIHKKYGTLNYTELIDRDSQFESYRPNSPYRSQRSVFRVTECR